MSPPAKVHAKRPMLGVAGVLAGGQLIDHVTSPPGGTSKKLTPS